MKAHEEQVNSSLAGGGGGRQPEWTESIAVGNQDYITTIKEQLGIRAKGRKIYENNGTYQLREERRHYNIRFNSEMSDIDGDNAVYWDA